MDCIVRSADRTLIEGNAERIVARSPHGEFAVLDGHAPILAVLVPGIIRVLANGTERVIVCKGGTFNLEDQRATVLVEQPYALEEIHADTLRARIAILQAEPQSASISEEIAYLELVCRIKETHA
ncbi:F0F1 ATP synthase subunit epsilon [Candidatus Bipolaricaulota bacterium]|nr:F0F1 ATP synthase subunit epsilon [Candidatus Bipolaricaulota bacterium]